MPGTGDTMDMEDMAGTMGMEATTDTEDTTDTDGMAIILSVTILTAIIRTVTRTHHMRIRRTPTTPLHNPNIRCMSNRSNLSTGITVRTRKVTILT